MRLIGRCRVCQSEDIQKTGKTNLLGTEVVCNNCKQITFLKYIKSDVEFVEMRNGDVSDGYHTFNELYFHRKELFKFVTMSFPLNSWKSRLHHDGTMYPNYFIVGVTTPEGDFSYHYHMDYWNEFDVKELERAPIFDGHASNDIGRIFSLLKK